MKTLKLVPGIILLAALLASCNTAALLDGAHAWTGGAISFRIQASAARTLVPALDMTIASYTFTGTGPNGATFSSVAAAATYTATNLAQGSWSVTANGLNAAGTVIGTGSASVNVVTGQTASVSINVAPIAGSGTLSITLNWPTALVSNPQIAAMLTSPTGTVTPLSFSAPSSGIAAYTGTVQNGYYTLSIQLLDNGQPVMGSVEIARIVTDQVTTGIYNYTSINSAQGPMAVTITPAVTNPIPVTITGAVSTTTTGSPLNLSASVPAGNTVTYAWYVNGAPAGTGAALVLNTPASPLPQGSYRVDCVALSTSGLNGGNATFTLDVTPGASTTAFQFIASVATRGANNAGAVLSAPSSLNVLAGDLLVAICSSENATTLAMDDGNGGNSFTMLAQSSVSGKVYQDLGYVLSAAADSAMVPVLHSNSSAHYTDFIVMQFRPTGTAVFDAGPSAGTGSGTTAQSGSISLTGASGLVIAGSTTYADTKSGSFSGQNIAGVPADGVVFSYYGSLWYRSTSAPPAGVNASASSPNQAWCADIMAFK